ncbi:MAG: hypothetical protein AB8G05_07550 [Oligoflexales bacterium]
MSAANPKKIIDDLSEHVEKKVKKLAIIAARKAVRSLWNASFSQAIEKEIKLLCTQSINHMEVGKVAKSHSKIKNNKNKEDSSMEAERVIPQVQSPEHDEEVTVSNNLNQINEEKIKEDASLTSSHSPKNDEQKTQVKDTSTEKNQVDAPSPIEDTSKNDSKSTVKPGLEIEEPSLSSRSTTTENSELLNQVKKVSNGNAVAQIDLLFLQILDTFVVKIASLARSSTEYILEVSNSFLDEKAKNALVDFHNLYFGENSIGETSKKINAEIDDMLENLQSILDEGKELTLNSIEESEEGKLNRLSLSGLQKRLEMIISMDAGIKQKLIPILHSMQFEDFLNQRLLHIRKMWAHVISMESSKSNIDLEKLKETLAKYPSSMDEREDFYNIVLKKEPPEGLKERQSLVDILF